MRTRDPRCDHGKQSHNVHHALSIISRFKEYLHDDGLNLAVLASYLPVIDSGKETGEKEVFVLQEIDEESLDAHRGRTFAQTDFGHVRRV